MAATHEARESRSETPDAQPPLDPNVSYEPPEEETTASPPPPSQGDSGG